MQPDSASGCWKRAYDSLDDNLKASINGARTGKIDILANNLNYILYDNRKYYTKWLGVVYIDALCFLQNYFLRSLYDYRQTLKKFLMQYYKEIFMMVLIIVA